MATVGKNFNFSNASVYIDTGTARSQALPVQSCDVFDSTSWGDASKTYVSGIPSTTGTFTVQLDGFYDAIKKTETTLKKRSEMQLFHYAVTYTPRDDDGKLLDKDARILIEPATMLAKNEKAVERVATRAVKDDGLNWDYVNVIVVPFGRY